DRNEFADSAAVSFACSPGRISLRGGFEHLQLQSSRTQAVERGSDEFAAFSSARGGVHNCGEGLVHRAPMAERSSVLAISSARTVRLILSEAVRGKSRSQMTYPFTRLKSGSLRFRSLSSSTRLESHC